MSVHYMRAVQEIEIAVPIQTFRFEYMLVGRSELSFIREFVLRLLKLGEMTPDQLAKFLGLSGKEIRAAISQLSYLKEVSIGSDGCLGLTPKSLRYFDGDSARPKVRSVFERTHTFKFDLFNFDHIHSSQNTGNPLRAIKLIPDPVISSDSSSHAKQAFLRSYLDVFEKESIRFDGISNLHDVELYKLSDIRKSRDYHVRITLRFNLDVERDTIERSCRHKLYDSSAISGAVNEYLSVASESDNIQSVASAMDIFEDSFSLDCLTPSGFDGTGYDIKLRSESSAKSGIEHFIGASTLSENWEKIYKPIKLLVNKASSGKGGKPQVIWVAPSDRHWLQSDAMFNRVKNLKELVKDSNFSLMLPVDGKGDLSGIRNWRSQLGELKEQSEKFCSGFLDGVVELIIVPEHLAVIVYHLQRPNEAMTIPLGFITEDRDMVKKIEDCYEKYLDSYSEDLESRRLGCL
ncbi:MAG: hypothetical protein P1U35_12815 [Cycloclasticus sp.]|nr:hypothetical protein [Cycloclasticus sp.]